MALRASCTILPLVVSCIVWGCAGGLDNDDGGAADVMSDAVSEAFGFDIRTPGTHAIEPAGEVSDVDYVCTLSRGEIEGYVYVRSDPVSCPVYTGCEFENAGAWISIDGVVSHVEASYGWGGHHHIDWINVLYGGLTYRYSHSSLGWGWQPCGPPDCLQVLDQSGALLEDGCEPIRSLPVVCEQVRSDGTFDPLVDDFEVCEGDLDAEFDAG